LLVLLLLLVRVQRLAVVRDADAATEAAAQLVRVAVGVWVVA
jgi:hypothetical protein